MSLLQVNCFYTIHSFLCKQKQTNLHIHLQYLLDYRSIYLKARCDLELSVSTQTNKKQSSCHRPGGEEKHLLETQVTHP